MESQKKKGKSVYQLIQQDENLKVMPGDMFYKKEIYDNSDCKKKIFITATLIEIDNSNQLKIKISTNEENYILILSNSNRKHKVIILKDFHLATLNFIEIDEKSSSASILIEENIAISEDRAKVKSFEKFLKSKFRSGMEVIECSKKTIISEKGLLIQFKKNNSKFTKYSLFESHFKHNNVANNEFIFYPNTGFYIDGYCEFNIGTSLSLRNKRRINKTLAKISKELYNNSNQLSLGRPTAIYQMLNYQHSDYLKSFSFTLKIKGCTYKNHLESLNQILFVLNSEIINSSASNSLRFATVSSLRRDVESASTKKISWNRLDIVKEIDPLSLIFLRSSFDSPNIEFNSFIQGFRAIEALSGHAALFDGEGSKAKLKRLLNKKNISLTLTSENEIVNFRNKILHNKSGENFDILFERLFEDGYRIKTELNNMYINGLLKDKMYNHITIPQPRIYKEHLKGLYTYNKLTGWGEIIIKFNPYNKSLYLKKRNKRNYLSDFSLSRTVEYEISSPTSEFISKHQVSDVSTTLKIKSSSLLDFELDVYKVLVHLFLIGLENTENTNSISYPDITNISRSFYESFNSVNYSKIKKINGFSSESRNCLNLINDALNYSNNTQFLLYYNFIDFFRGRKSHGEFLRKIFRQYGNQISNDVKHHYKKFLTEKYGTSINNNDIYKYFGEFRNLSTHGDSMKGIQSLFYWDEEILVQTMMARELCIHLLNDKCIQ